MTQFACYVSALSGAIYRPPRYSSGAADFDMREKAKLGRLPIPSAATEALAVFGHNDL